MLSYSFRVFDLYNGQLFRLQCNLSFFQFKKCTFVVFHSKCVPYVLSVGPIMFVWGNNNFFLCPKWFQGPHSKIQRTQVRSYSTLISLHMLPLKLWGWVVSVWYVSVYSEDSRPNSLLPSSVSPDSVLEFDIVTGCVEAFLFRGSLFQFVHFLLYSLSDSLPPIHHSFNVDVWKQGWFVVVCLMVISLCNSIEMLMRRKTAPVRKSHTSKRKSRKQHQLVM